MKLPNIFSFLIKKIPKIKKILNICGKMSIYIYIYIYNIFLKGNTCFIKSTQIIIIM